jgi:alpha-tubulin suppressor-like RCC1 family protein
VNSHISYTTVEESELEGFVDFFSLHHQDRVNLAQYIYCLDPTYFASDLVYTVGLNDNGRLGTGKPDNTGGPAESRNSMISDVVIDESHLNQAIALKKDRIQEISQVKIGVPVQKVSCGHKFTLALDMAGQIWAWGKGGDGCLGTGQLEDKWYPELINFTHFGNTNEEIAIIDISAGSEHCLAINKCNEIFSWGKGNQGRLGHDNEVASLIPKKIAFFTLKEIKVASISAGEQHSACITQNHELYTWGSGANYRLGHGSLHNSLKPERVQHISDHYVIKVSSGSTHTLCLTRDGHIFAMGSGINGRLGIDIAGGNDYKTPTRIAPYNEEVKLKSFVEVVAGPHQSFGLTDEGELLAWGSIKFKTLGIVGLKGDLHVPTPIHLGGLKFHFKKKKKKTDAENKNRVNFDSYDLAFQEKLDKSNPPFEIVRVFCGETNTVYLMANGDIYICGSGQHGQLCINPETKGEEFCGDKAALKELFMEEEIVYSHTPIYLPINLEIKFKYVAIGLSHIIALTVEGQAYAWGKNTEGQLGIGSGSRYLYKPTLIEEVFVKKFAMCVASHTYSALLSESGEVWVFGSAEYGCLGINATKQNYDVPTPKMINNIPPMKYIAAAPQHMAAITTDGELYVWGNNNNGRLGIEGKNQKVWVPRKVTITNVHGHAMFKQVSL